MVNMSRFYIARCSLPLSGRLFCPLNITQGTAGVMILRMILLSRHINFEVRIVCLAYVTQQWAIIVYRTEVRASIQMFAHSAAIVEFGEMYGLV
jgi:hypothetical protein